MLHRGCYTLARTTLDVRIAVEGRLAPLEFLDGKNRTGTGARGGCPPTPTD